MGRKTIEILIEDEGRDKGKRFIIREMPASQAEKWAARAFLALTKSGIEVPDDVISRGMVGIVTLWIQAFSGVPWETAEPLLDEMFRCVQIRMPQVIRDLVEDDIEEVATRVRLRKEVLKLHVDFSQVVGALTSRQATAATTTDASPSTATFPTPSPQ